MIARHRVLIVGGGFGGLAAAKALRGAPVDVTVVNRPALPAAPAWHHVGAIAMGGDR